MFTCTHAHGSVVAWRVESASNAGDPSLIPGWEDPLKKETTTHSSILAWKIPWTEEPGGLQFTGSQRVGQNWETSLSHRWRLGIRHMTKSGKVRRQMLRKGWFGTLKTNCPFLVSLKYRRKFLNLYNYLKICQLMVYTVPKQKFETNKRYQSPKNFWHPQ